MAHQRMKELRLKQRYVAEEGDLIGLYGDEKKEFRLAIALDNQRALVIFDNLTGIRIDLVRIIIKNSNIISTISFNDEIYLSSLSKSDYEVYSTNIFNTPLKYNLDLAKFFDILRTNLQNIQHLRVGDIVKMKGLKLSEKIALYHHHALFSDAKKFKIIHKWGEPTRSELFQSLLGDKSLSYAEVREDNILEVACCRELEAENCYDSQYSDHIRKPTEIIAEAKKRIGETSYDLLQDNCQHFCTSCRYGIPLAIEVENTKKVAKYGMYGALIAGALGFVAYNTYKGSQNAKKTEEKPSDNKSKNDI